MPSLRDERGDDRPRANHERKPLTGRSRRRPRGCPTAPSGPSWIADYTVGSLFVAVAVFVLATGIAEELIFRGILLKLGADLVGPNLALLYITAVFAALHLGFRSPLDILFILTVALFFGLVAWKTKILWGVIASHTLINVVLYVVAPRL